MKCDSQNADEIDAHNTVIVKKNGVEDNIYGSIRKPIWLKPSIGLTGVGEWG